MKYNEEAAMKSNGFLAEFKKNKPLFVMICPAVILTIVMAYLPMSGLADYKEYHSI